MFMYLYRASWHSSATLTEVFPCFFLSCKANAKEKLTKTGHGPHLKKKKKLCCYIYCFVSFCVLFVCKCVLYTATGWQPNCNSNKYIKPLPSVSPNSHPLSSVQPDPHFVLHAIGYAASKAHKTP
jgi:hypothetical protein